MVVIIYHRQSHSGRQVMLEAAIQSWKHHLKGVEPIDMIVVGDKVPDSIDVQNIVVPIEEGADDLLRCVMACKDREAGILADSRTIVCNDLNPAHLLLPMDNLTVPHLYRIDELCKPCTGGSFLHHISCYRETCEPGMVIQTDWRKDNWILPAVSKNPPASLIKQLIKEKLFIRFAPSSDSSQTELFVEGMFLQNIAVEDGH